MMRSTDFSIMKDSKHSKKISYEQFLLNLHSKKKVWKRYTEILTNDT